MSAGSPLMAGSGPVLGRASRRLSASALNRYRNCPKQFWFTDIERLPQGPPGPILAQGTAVHEALERLMGLPLEQRSAETAERALRAVWCKHRTGLTFSSREDEAAFGREALDMVRRFAQTSDLTISPLAREQWLDCRLENGVTLRGKLDRIDARAGAIELIDYKTGQRQLQADELPDEPAAIIYLLLAEQAYQQPVERVRYLYLRSGQAVDWYPERDDVEEYSRRLLELSSEVVERQEWPASPGTHCRWCVGQLQCPDRQRVSLEDLVPVEDLPF